MTDKKANATSSKPETKGAPREGQRGQAGGHLVGGGDDRGARAPEKALPEANGKRKHAR